MADHDEDRLKTFLKMKNWRAFDRTLSPRNNPNSFNGETEVFQIRLDQLPELEEFTTPQGTKRNDLTDAMVLAAVARHLRAELERIFPSVAHDDDDDDDNEPFDEPDIDEPDADFLEDPDQPVGGVAVLLVIAHAIDQLGGDLSREFGRDQLGDATGEDATVLFVKDGPDQAGSLHIGNV